MQDAWQDLIQMIVGYLPSLIGAIAILVLGWLLALVAAAIIRGALRRTSLDNRIATWVLGEERGQALEVERIAGRVTFYLVMLFVLVGFFQALGLTLVTEPLNRALGEISQFLPRLLGAVFLLLVAWLIATGVRFLLLRLPGAAKLDAQLGSAAGLEGEPSTSVTRTLADTAFWLVFLLFLPAVLGALALEGLLGPVQAMLTVVLGYLPNIFAAGLILLAGWFAARILQRIVTNLLVAAGADRLSDRIGLAPALGPQRLSGMLGLVVYVLVLIPVVVASLDALQLAAISQPASDVLNRILSVLPSIFAAAVVVGIAYVLGKLVSTLVTNLLTGIGFNAVLRRLGLAEAPGEGKRSPSSLVGFVVLLAIMLLASMEASRVMGFPLLADFIAEFNIFAARVLLGMVIFALGLYLANLVQERVGASRAANAGLLAVVARISILVVAAAMAIQQMGIGSEITTMVLGISLGAIGITLAIAFGLGAREPAARLVEQWLDSMRRKGDAA